MIRAWVVMLFMVVSVPAGHGQAVAPAKTLKISQRNQSLLGRLGNYPDLEILSINCIEDLRALPDSIGKLAKLKQLIIDNGNGCSMNPVLPERIGNLHLLEKLVLYGAQDPAGTGTEPPEHPKALHPIPDSISHLQILS